MIPSLPKATLRNATRAVLGAAALATLVGLGLGRLASLRPDPGERLERARDLALDRRPDDAMRELRRALADFDDADRSGMRLRVLVRTAQLADYHQGSRRPADALGWYRRIAQEYPGTPEAFDAGVRIAEILALQGDDAHAEEQYAALAEAHSAQAGVERLLLRAARVAIDARRFEAARRHAARLLEGWPASDAAVEAQGLVGAAWHLEGRHREAAEAWEAVAARWPDSAAAARALHEAGNCLAEQGDFARSVARYIEALPRHPDPSAVQQSLERARKRLSHLRSIEAATGRAVAFDGRRSSRSAP